MSRLLLVFIGGLKGWLVLGLLAGALNIVPYIGPVLGAIPPILIGIGDAPTTAVYAIITIVIAQLIDNLYIIPFMISGMVRTDALLGIILILVGAQLFGIFGMVFAIPMYRIYKIILRDTYQGLTKVYKG